MEKKISHFSIKWMIYEFQETSALSFYSSKTFWFGPNVSCHTKKILSKTKRWFPFSKFNFCASTTFFSSVTKFNSIFGRAQTICTGKKHFGTCRRKRHLSRLQKDDWSELQTETKEYQRAVVAMLRQQRLCLCCISTLLLPRGYLQKDYFALN